ncbi:MAG: carbohydrate kinase [Pseudoalteromonas distincta]|uniref:carbohydrate kinase family protein n=1 Tax=unclassified Pseudoalteromonas TaxID=194690 RepID=UPI00041A9AA0|nr:MULTISPECIES: carbohydrate kinase [unclassified Pseudoalteromonas]|tara:strand:- start:1241 stop:2233 length:993 start_codon:yes stop_codon:yes gene_type:complete
MEVVAIGEALIDILSHDCMHNKASNSELDFTQFAGGAPANVAVAVAKLGGSSYLLGKVGNDKFGRFLINALKMYNVNTSYVGFSKKGKTALAFVSLDENGERTFEFYDKDAAHYDLQITDLEPSLFSTPKIVSFCSGSFAKPLVLNTTLHALKHFKESGSVTCFDINFRSAFWDEPLTAKSVIEDVAKTVDVIKASKDELISLYGIEHIDTTIRSWVDSGVALVLMTDGGEPITFSSSSFSGTYPCPKAYVVDTTAAGDAFVGGFLYQISSLVSNKTEFTDWASNFTNVSKAIDFATKCGAKTVATFGAFDALPTYHDISASTLKSSCRC